MSLMRKSITGAAFAVSLFVGAQLASAAPAQAQAAATPVPAERGAILFRQRCASCHSIVPGARSPQGPHLAGVMGRRSATAPGYAYSRGMQNANRTWNATTLDAFLTSPSRAVPGTRMMASVTNVQDRAAIVAYLATQRATR